MGRDLLVLHASDDPQAASQLDSSNIKPLGTRKQILSIIKALFPDTDVSDPKWVIVTRPNYSLRFSMSDQEPVDALLVTVHGEEIAVDDVNRLANATGWRVFDSSRGEFLDMTTDRSTV
jgi:hypothetical protein